MLLFKSSRKQEFKHAQHAELGAKEECHQTSKAQYSEFRHRNIRKAFQRSRITLYNIVQPNLRGQTARRLCALLRRLPKPTIRLTLPSHFFRYSAKESPAQSFYTKQASIRQLHTGTVHTVLVFDEINENSCQSIYTALVNGYTAPQAPHLFQKSKGEGYADKIVTFNQYIQDHVKDDDTVILADGYDVRFQLPLQTLLQRFQHSGSDIMVGGDKWCWPNKWNSPACQAVPASKLPADTYYGKEHGNMPRWVNAGVIVGQGMQMRRLFHLVNEMMLYQQSIDGQIDDQGFIAEILTNASYTFKYAIDSSSQLIQTMQNAENDIVWDVNPSGLTPSTSRSATQLQLHLSDLLEGEEATRTSWQRSFWHNRPLLRNTRANTIPAIIHFNGYHQKVFLTTWWTKFWMVQRDVKELLHVLLALDGAPNAAGIWSNGAWYPYTSLCGMGF